MTQETDWTQMQAKYWNAFSELARNAAAGQSAAAAPATPAWQDGMQQWSKLFANQPNAQSDVVERMLASAKSYLATMQATLGGAFANPASSFDSAGNAATWMESLRQAFAGPGGGYAIPGVSGMPGGAMGGFAGMPGMGATPGFGPMAGFGAMPGLGAMPGMPPGFDAAAFANNPFARSLRDISGQGAKTFEQFGAQLAPFIEAAKSESATLLNLPAFGSSREKQERLQKLIRAWGEYEAANARYNAELGKSTQRGFEILESKLAERSEPGRQIDSVRGFYDLWVDSAEEAYAELAMGEHFRGVYGDYVNSQMRVRKLVQDEIELTSREFGMPTRSELNSVEKRLHEVRREQRRSAEAQADEGVDEVTRLRAEIDELKRIAANEVVAKPAPARKPRAERPAANKSATVVKLVPDIKPSVAAKSATDSKPASPLKRAALRKRNSSVVAPANGADAPSKSRKSASFAPKASKPESKHAAKAGQKSVTSDNGHGAAHRHKANAPSFAASLSSARAVIARAEAAKARRASTASAKRR